MGDRQPRSLISLCSIKTDSRFTNEYIRRVNAYKGDKVVETAAFLAELYCGGKNVQLEKKIYDYTREHVAPVMKKIILQGVKEGTFKTEFPEEAAET